jgi:hypothetical protein
MKCPSFIKIFFVFFLLLAISCFAQSQDKKPFSTDTFYNKSLHYTSKGIIFNYSKEQNGLEKLSGLSAKEIGCDKPECHVKSCDVCHADILAGKPAYTTNKAKSEDACQYCHGDNKDNPDTHFARGMKCMDCHSSREIHGDGKEYNSYNEPGAMDTKCQDCHTGINPSTSHNIHKEKLDCAACHTIEMKVCHNCHIDTKIKDKKSASLPMKDIFFLVNHNGKVKLANFLSYVYGNKTMITFAPAFEHKITKEGRKCKECHDTQITRDLKDNKFRPIRWEKDTLVNAAGFVPVVEGMKWDLDYLNRENGKWSLIKDPAPPIVTYSGYCTPLRKEQFEKLAKGRGPK